MAGKLLVKDTVTFVYHPAGFRILEAVKAVARRLAIDVVVTSGSDGAHSGPGDPHHTGEAYDLRTHGLSPAVKISLLRGIQSELQDNIEPRRFYSFIEAPGTANEHIHVQRRKSTVFSMLDYFNS